MPHVRDHILLYVNGRPVRVSGDDAFLTLSDLLRRRRQLTGTKVVCAEGDCGSCAVMVGRPVAGVGGGAVTMKYAAVTSCIQLAFQLDGAHVVTVEGLKDGRDLNPIQKSMVACHGAQCGFCTPGIVVSLYDVMHDPARDAGPEAVRRGLVGNLCRCTGYDSIFRAAAATNRSAVKPVDTLYPPGPIAAALSAAGGEAVRVEAGGRLVYKPTSLADAFQFRRDRPECLIVSGATDLGVVHNKRARRVDVALSLGGLAELRGARVEADAIYVGAAEPLSTLERLATERLPELGRFMAWFGSPLIKNAGTLGGNLVTGSPIGDTLPAMTVLRAEIDVAGPLGRRRVAIGSFYTGYRKTVLAADELVTGIRIPLPAAGETFKLYKVSRRKDLDISAFGAAIRVRIEGDTVADARIAFGGVGPMVLRMTRAEDALRGGPATLAAFRQAGELAAQDVTPISDVRGSEIYRRTLAKNILVKFWHEAVEGRNVSGPLSPSVLGGGEG